MQTYFTAIQPHLEDHVDIAFLTTNQLSNSPCLASLGIDNIIFVKNLSNQQQNRIVLTGQTVYQCIATSPNSNHCILGCQNGTIQQFNLSNNSTKIIFKSSYKINALTNSPTKKYLAIASEQSKCIILDLYTMKTSKCRPGHESGVANAVFSEDQKYLASIGQDKTLFIYNIQNFDQPIENFNFKISKSDLANPLLLTGSFHKFLPIFYAPGMKQLQIVELLNNKWDLRMSKFIKHATQIIQLTKIIKNFILVTCSANQFIIWNNKSEQKLVMLDHFTLNKILQINQTFWGCKQDGRIFHYKKVLNEALEADVNQESQKMELQDGVRDGKDQLKGNQSVLMFNEEQIQNQDKESSEQGQKSVISEPVYEIQKQKKSIADRLIKAYPQSSVETRTSQFDNAHYINTSHHGYIICKNESEYEKRIQFETQQKPNSELLFLNKQILFSDFNSTFVAYANETLFGVKFFKNTEQSLFDQNQSWEKQWEDIACIACSQQWLAVANDSEIKIIDVAGNEIKSFSFDRIIVAMAAYQNLLAVVYHQSIPIDGSQLLSMKLYIINHQIQEVLKCSECHVPLKPKSVLKFFRFSNEGMLLTQDCYGYIRVYNLQTNTWVNVFIEGIEDSRRIWVLGMKNYRLIYWKCAELNPDPQVTPRLGIKQSRLGINLAIEDLQNMKQYPFLMFERYCLDHQKCRCRLWHKLKQTKSQKYPGYQENISTILSSLQLVKHHNQLDVKFFQFIKQYLRNTKTHIKALMAAKSWIRSIAAGKHCVQAFDKVGLRSLAVQLQIFFEEKQREQEYQKMQELELKNLKEEAERCIKPKSQNNPFNKKKVNDYSSIPSFPNSQMSQTSSYENFSEKSGLKASKQNGMKMANKLAIIQTPQKQEISNPYLKKEKSKEEIVNKAKQIEEQIEKFGIKKKSDVPKRQQNLSKL